MNMFHHIRVKTQRDLHINLAQVVKNNEWHARHSMLSLQMQMFYPKIVSRSPLKERLPLRTILFPFKIFDIGKNVFCKICLYLDHDISLDEDTAMSFFRLLYQ